MSVQSKIVPKKNLRQKQAETRREHLVDVALELFSEQGYAATSIKQIAERAGVAIGLLYHYFPGKSELLRAIMERHSFLPELKSLLLIEGDAPAAQVLQDIATGFSALLDRRESLFRLIVGESQSNPEVAACLNGVVSQGMTALSTYLETRVQAKELQPHNTTLTARILFSTVLATHLTRLPAPSWAELVEQLLHGLIMPIQEEK